MQFQNVMFTLNFLPFSLPANEYSYRISTVEEQLLNDRYK